MIVASKRQIRVSPCTRPRMSMRCRSYFALFFVLAFGCRCGEETSDLDLDCIGCRADGDRCDYDTNCQPGSICNTSDDEFYVAELPTAVCVSVVCDVDADCPSNRRCTLERFCRLPVCQVDESCGVGEMCIGGECAPAPSASVADRCAIVTPDQVLSFGASVTVEAVAFDKDGQVIPRATFDWASSDPGVASISGATVTASTREGSAEIHATVQDAPNTICTGLTIHTFEPVAEGRMRVVVADAKTGSPVSGVEVSIASDAMVTGTTDVVGRFDVAAMGTIASVTVVKAGWRSITVLAPASRDIFLAMPRSVSLTNAGGIRGSVDMSRMPAADIEAAVVYSARSLDLFEYRAVPTVDIVATELRAPELGLDSVADLPGNFVIALRENQFTRDNTRCVGDEGGLGCFLARTPEGQTAAWVMGGRYSLTEISAIASDGFALETPDRYTTKDRARLALLFSPLLQRRWYGVLPYLDVEASSKVPQTSSDRVDCGDPATAISKSCRADFDKYQHKPMALVQRAAITTEVRVPTLPDLPSVGCANAMVASSYAILPGRGLVLLGLGAGKDEGDTLGPDCVVDGIEEPFGPNAARLDDGAIGLSSTPLHSGLEGSARMIVLTAIDVGDGETRPLDLNLIAAPFDRLDQRHDLSARSFLPYPKGTLSSSTAVFTGDVSARASGTRLTIESAEGSWIVYAPPTMSRFELPDVAAPRGVLTTAAYGTVQAFEVDGTYEDLWSLDSSVRIDASLPRLRAIATTQCGETGPCIIR